MEGGMEGGREGGREREMRGRGGREGEGEGKGTTSRPNIDFGAHLLEADNRPFPLRAKSMQLV